MLLSISAGSARHRSAHCRAVLASIAPLALKLAYWRDIDLRPHDARRRGRPASAMLSRVRTPHTEANYITRGWPSWSPAGTRARCRDRLGAAVRMRAPLAGLLLHGRQPVARWACHHYSASRADRRLPPNWLFCVAQARHLVTLYYWSCVPYRPAGCGNLRHPACHLPLLWLAFPVPASAIEPRPRARDGRGGGATHNRSAALPGRALRQRRMAGRRRCRRSPPTRCGRQQQSARRGRPPAGRRRNRAQNWMKARGSNARSAYSAACRR